MSRKRFARTAVGVPALAALALAVAACRPQHPGVADHAADPEAVVTLSHDAEARAHLVQDAMCDLNERERFIIRERKLEEEVKTLEALGEQLGISKERVRQIEGNALAKLKRALLARVADPVEAGFVGV